MSGRRIKFDETQYDFQGIIDGVYIWHTPQGDELTLVHHNTPTDLPADLTDLAVIRDHYRAIAHQRELGVIEIETFSLADSIGIRILFKGLQQPTGRTYLGKILVPNQGSSDVLSIHCTETGMTGVRDTIVGNQLRESGEISFDPDSGKTIGWLTDPYDANEMGAMTRNQSERPDFDPKFPDHPLSRVRSVLNHLQATLELETIET